MDLDTLILRWCCWIEEGSEEMVAGRRLRQWGPATALADSEVLTSSGSSWDWIRTAHSSPTSSGMGATSLRACAPSIAPCSCAKPPICVASRSSENRGCASACRMIHRWRSSRVSPSQCASSHALPVASALQERRAWARITCKARLLRLASACLRLRASVCMLASAGRASSARSTSPLGTAPHSPLLST
jgi:hypothetical protein